MKKPIKKKIKSVKLSKPTGTPMALPTQEIGSSFDNVEIKNTISKLELYFPNEDMNKVVEKINEIIEKQYGTI